MDERTLNLWNQANALYKNGQLESAIAIYEQIVEKIEDPSAYFNKGLLELKAQQYEEAREDFERAYRIFPSMPDLTFNLGLIEEKLGNSKKAMFWFDKAKQIEKNKIQADEAISRLNEKNESKDEISEETDKIVRINFFKSTTTFKDVIGIDNVKRYLFQHVVLPIQRPDLPKKYGKKLANGVLLYGPPGTGKTFMAKALAGEAGCNFIVARIEDIMGMYTGVTSKNVKMIFDTARKNTPCIIFFDELDALGGKRHSSDDVRGEGSAMRDAINVFLTQMDGIEKNPEGIYVLGSTNRPTDIDPALKRAGRFQETVYIPPPNYKERRLMVQYYLNNKPHKKVNLDRISRALAGYSPADVAKICDEATIEPILKEYSTNKESFIDTKGLLKIVKRYSRTSLDGWYLSMKKEMLGRIEIQMIDDKIHKSWRQGSLELQEKILYRDLIKDILKNTTGLNTLHRKIERFIAIYFW